MAQTTYTPIDFNGLEILNVRAQQLASDPGSPTEGRFYYNTVSKTWKFYNGSAWIDIGRLDQISAPTASVSLNSQKITNLLDPTNPQDAATKNYVDLAITGLDFKQSVRLLTTSNDTLSGLAARDGVTPVAGDRVLVPNQTTASANGIYIAAAGAWTRATDSDTSAELGPGAFVFVEEGSVYGDTGWVMTANNPFTLGSSSQTWIQFTGAGQVIAGNGLTKTGNTLDVQVDGVLVVITADTVTIGLIDIAHGGTGATTAAGARTNLGAAGVFAATIGDNTSTTFNLDHNKGTLDVLVNVVRVSDGASVFTDVVRSTINRVIVSFAVAPTTNQFRALIAGIG